MSLRDAQRVLRWDVVMEALTAAGVDSETRAMVEQARQANDVAQGLAGMLIGGADTRQAKNYVKFEMVGLVGPFDRVYAELVREGGKTSHELRVLLRDKLGRVRQLLAEGPLLEALRTSLLASIDAVLAEETP
jgi:hypothetical protein